MSTHTQGRIEFRPNGEANSYALVDETGNWWLSLIMNGKQVTERQIENLQRMAACWNACNGVSTEILIQHYAIDEDKEAILDELQSQRDELLALCKSIWPIMQDARRAIGKINVERSRGMGYYHAEVEWLLERNQEIAERMMAIKAATAKLEGGAA